MFRTTVPGPKPRARPSGRRSGSLVFRRCLAIALSLTGSAAAQGAGELSLQEAERLALLQHDSLKAEDARLQAAEAEIDRARSAYHPRLSAELSGSLSPGHELVEVPSETGQPPYLVSGTRGLGSGLDAFRPQARYGLDLQLTGNLYDFGRTAAAVDASQARRDAVEAERGGTRERVVQRVRAAYLSWLAAHELLRIAEQQAADARQERERVEALIAEGARPTADRTLAQTSELSAELSLEQARADVDNAGLSLSRAIGQPIASDATPDRGLLSGTPKAQSPTDDPALRALSRQRLAAQAAARVHEKGHAPVLAGAMSAGIQAQNDSFFPSYAVGLSLTVPLWDGGSSSAEAGMARARAEELAARMHERRADSEFQNERAALALQQAERRLARAQALREAAEQRLRETQERYTLGASGVDQVAESRRVLRLARTEVLRAQLARAEATLLKGQP